MVERNRVAVVIKNGGVVGILSSYPILFDLVNLDTDDNVQLLEEFENLEALRDLLPYQTEL